MAVYAIHCIDKPLQQELRAAQLAQHRAYVATATGLLVSGTLLDDEGQPIGTMLLAGFSDRRDAVEFAANDPFARAGLYASIAVTVWVQDQLVGRNAPPDSA